MPPHIKASNRFSSATNTARGRGRLTAAWLNSAASVKPLANSSATTARRSMIRTRAWAAPQVHRAGQFLQDSAAPKISALLFSAARRLAPAKTRAPRWRKLAGVSALGAAASVAAAAAAARGRRKQDSTAVPDQEDSQDAAPAPEARATHLSASADADSDRPPVPPDGPPAEPPRTAGASDRADTATRPADG
jgi:hypothetical protein